VRLLDQGILSTIHRVPVEILDATNVEAWLDAVARAGAVLLEKPSNPLMRLIDIEGTVARAHACGAPVITDIPWLATTRMPQKWRRCALVK
jgi:methionine-gamma-lyase